MTDALAAFRAAGNDLGLLTDPADIARYRQDATRYPGPAPRAVLRPRDTAGVAEAMAICHALRQPVVVQGGLTGLSGGARPQEGEVALSLERLTTLGVVDPSGPTLLAGAGVSLLTVQETAQAAGFLFGVDIGSRGTATVGGIVSTNAGGIRVLRYGMTRAQLAGVEAVLPDGTVVTSLKGLAKNNTGADLSQLFCGTEGTLGIVTRALFRLHPNPAVTANALISLNSVKDALTLLARLRAALGLRLSAFEGIWPQVYAGIATLRPLPIPAGAGMYVVAEIHGFDPQADRPAFENALMSAIEDGLCQDVVMSQSEREFHDIWAIREGSNDYTRTLGPVKGHDIAVPLAAIPAFVAEADTATARLDPAARPLVFGHLGDGNLHYVVQTSRADLVSPEIHAIAARHGGTIAAEHGVGVEKKPYITLVRSEGELSALRRLKAAFDPDGILNRGRILD